MRFDNYFKVADGNNQYKLKKQNTRFYFIGILAGVSENTFTRTNKSTETFQMRTLQWSWRFLADVFITLYDGNKNNPKYRMALPSGTGTLSMNLQDIHRIFNNDLIIEATTTAGVAYVLAGAEFVTCTTFGWDEEI